MFHKDCQCFCFIFNLFQFFELLLFRLIILLQKCVILTLLKWFWHFELTQYFINFFVEFLQESLLFLLVVKFVGFTVVVVFASYLFIFTMYWLSLLLEFFMYPAFHIFSYLLMDSLVVFDLVLRLFLFGLSLCDFIVSVLLESSSSI